jgi:hypothetical protein
MFNKRSHVQTWNSSEIQFSQSTKNLERNTWLDFQARNIWLKVGLGV